MPNHRVVYAWGWGNTGYAYNARNNFDWPHRFGFRFNPFTGEPLHQWNLQTFMLPDWEGVRPEAYTVACIANPIWGLGLHWNWAEPMNFIDHDRYVCKIYFVRACHVFPETIVGGKQGMTWPSPWDQVSWWDTAEGLPSYSWRSSFRPTVLPVGSTYDPPIPIIGNGLIPPTHVGNNSSGATFNPYMGMWVGAPDQIPNDQRCVVVPMTVHPIDGSFIPSGWMAVPHPSEIGNPNKDLIIARRFPINPPVQGLAAKMATTDQDPIYMGPLDLDGVTRVAPTATTPPLTDTVTWHTSRDQQYAAWQENNRRLGTTDEDAEASIGPGRPFVYYEFNLEREIQVTGRRAGMLIDYDPYYEGGRPPGYSTSMGYIRDKLIDEPPSYDYPMIDPPEDLPLFTPMEVEAQWVATQQRYELILEELAQHVGFAPLPTTVDPDVYFEGLNNTGQIMDVEAAPMDFTSEGTMPCAPEYTGPDISFDAPADAGDTGNPAGDYGVWGDYDWGQYQDTSWDPSNSDPGGPIDNGDNQNGDTSWEGNDGPSEGGPGNDGGGWGGDGGEE